MKHEFVVNTLRDLYDPFSILERIDVGETPTHVLMKSISESFSILERIDVGETNFISFPPFESRPFSILERIDVGETLLALAQQSHTKMSFSILERIDVGETPVCPHPRTGYCSCFQYPRTDRRG